MPRRFYTSLVRGSNASSRLDWINLQRFGSFGKKLLRRQTNFKGLLKILRLYDLEDKNDSPANGANCLCVIS
jgi:hypothetical protein